MVWELEEGESRKLSNVELQARSGIRSSRSYDAARRELIEAGLIEYEEQWYRLGGNIVRKGTGKGMEREWKGGNVLKFEKKREEERKGITTTTTTTARDSATAAAAIQADGAANFGNQSDVSNAVKAEWRKWNGAPLNMGVTLELIGLEKELGTQGLIELIRRAGLGDKFGTLTIRYVKSLRPSKAKKTAVAASPKIAADKYGVEDEL